MNPKYKKFDPAVNKKFLIALSGILWTIVGIALCNLAVGWLSESVSQNTSLLGAGGILLAMLIHHFGFLRIVDKNIERILSKSGKVCIFAFQPWKSYLLILIMVAMGMFLRNSAMPKHYLAVLYIGFGGAMLLSSLRYHRNFYKLMFKPGTTPNKTEN
jgi:hypothetical protein